MLTTTKQFSSNMVEQYSRRNTATLYILQEDGVMGGCTIDMVALAKIASPSHYVVTKPESGPRITVYHPDYGRQLPQKAQALDASRRLKSLEVVLTHDHPSTWYDRDNVVVRPVYEN